MPAHSKGKASPGTRESCQAAAAPAQPRKHLPCPEGCNAPTLLNTNQGTARGVLCSLMSERIQCQPWLVRNPQQFSLNFHTLPQSQRFFKTGTGIASIKTFTIGTYAGNSKPQLQESSRTQGHEFGDPCGSLPIPSVFYDSISPSISAFHCQE